MGDALYTVAMVGTASNAKALTATFREVLATFVPLVQSRPAEPIDGRPSRAIIRPDQGAGDHPGLRRALCNEGEGTHVQSTPPQYAPPYNAPGGAGYGAPAPVYSMVTTFDQTVSMSRLWGIPFLGVWLRAILAIPHWIILAFYGIAAVIVMWVAWIPVLINGRYPSWGYSVVGGYLRWMTRVEAYVMLAAAAYPPFSTSARHDVDVRWNTQQAVPRWAGIPLFGMFVRALLLIPHVIVLWVLGLVAGLLALVTWFPVLMTGHYAGWAYDLVGGYVRWQNRVASYILLMTGPYPPFSLSD